MALTLTQAQIDSYEQEAALIQEKLAAGMPIPPFDIRDELTELASAGSELYHRLSDRAVDAVLGVVPGALISAYHTGDLTVRSLISIVPGIDLF